MKIDHIGIYTTKLEELKNYYTRYFNGVSNNLYINEKKGFRSYFITFNSGTRIELMTIPTLRGKEHAFEDQLNSGFVHLAFELKSMEEVDNKALRFIQDGFKIIDGPRITGDGYYEFVTLDPDNNRIEITTRL